MRRLAWQGAIALAASLTAAPLSAEGSATSMGWFSNDKKGDYRDCVSIATAGKASQLPRNIGIGKLCAAIEDAWKLNFVDNSDTAFFDTTLNVLKVEFGKAIPNCEDQQNRRAEIDASAVARLLSIQGLLPPHYSGGLALHKFKFKEAFVLYNASVDTPVAFVDSAFCGGKIERDSIGLNSLGGEKKKSDRKVAIYLNSVHFKKRFMVSKSTINGDVIVPNTRFEDSLAFIDINKENRDNSANSKSSLIILHSNIDRSLVLQGGIYTDEVSIRSNSINSLLIIENPEFRTDFWLGDNEIGGSWIIGARIRGKTKIIGNRFRGALWIWGVGFSHLGEGQAEPEIAGNQIGGEFVLKMIPEANNVGRISLESNEVQGDASVTLTKDWWGTIDFTNFRANAGLWIIREIDEVRSDGLTLPCKRISGENDSLRPPLILALDLARIRLLNWNIPINCEYRWTGNGLRYDSWVPGKNALSSIKETKETEWEAFKVWRLTVTESALDPYNYMADYLKSRGRYNESRAILEEAKRLNYIKDIPTKTDSPDFSGFVECVSQWNIRCITSYVLYVFLYPGGYGAFPERALLFIIAGWILFYGIYKVYSTLCTPGSGGDGSPTDVPGFMHFDVNLHPPKFSIWRYSLDAMLPVINLHAYNRYYLKAKFLRWTAAFQHILGWWLISVFLASATIL